MRSPETVFMVLADVEFTGTQGCLPEDSFQAVALLSMFTSIIMPYC